MFSQPRLLVAMLTTTLVLLLGAGAAHASRSIEISETRLQLTGRVTFRASLGEVICNTTFEKTVSRVIPKVLGTLMGRITDIRTSNCTFPQGMILEIRILIGALENGTLWRLFYEGFLGTLPEITGIQIRIENTQVLLALLSIPANFACLYEGPIEGLAEIQRETGTIRTLRDIETADTTNLKTDLRAEHERRLGRTFGACPTTGRFRAELRPSMPREPRIILLS